jgi:hypothetical protein
MHKGIRYCLGVVISGGILSLPSYLQAVEMGPFYTQNQSPVIQIFGLPSIGEPSLVPARKTDLRFIMDLANNFIEDNNQRESIVLDGESTRFTLDARYGIAKNFEVGLVIPYIIEGGGFTDGFIDWYHNPSVFPRGGGITRRRIAFSAKLPGITKADTKIFVSNTTLIAQDTV